VTGPSANNSYNNILAKLGWPIKNGELSSQLAGQQWVKSLKGLPLVGIARGVVATSDQLLVETSLSTRWFQPWRRGRNWEPLVVVSPSGSMFVGLAGG
jgi:hypothetical protein